MTLKQANQIVDNLKKESTYTELSVSERTEKSFEINVACKKFSRYQIESINRNGAGFNMEISVHKGNVLFTIW